MQKWDTTTNIFWLKLTKKQKEFADEYLKTWNGTQAALKAYNIKNKEWTTAGVIASENLRKHNVLEYLQDNAQIAASVIMELVEDKTTPAAVRLWASKDVLDRAWYKPVERIQELNLNVNVESMSTEELLSLIKQK